MVEQTYTLHYLGCSVLSKGTTGLGVIQKPLKDLYFSFRKKQTKSPTEVYMQITREGLNMLTPDGTAQGHQLKSTLHKFQLVNYVEAVQFTSKNNSRKTQYAFMPLDDKRTVSSPEKLFATLDKKNNYLLKMNHQPIIVCLIRRQTGVKALDCHVFISLSPTDALKIVDSFSQMEQLASQKEYKGDFRAVPQKANVGPPTSGPQWDYRTDYRSPYPDHGYPATGNSDPSNQYDGRYQLRDEHFRGSQGTDNKTPKPNDQHLSASYGGMHYHPPHSMAGAAAGGPMQNYQPRGYGDVQERARPYGDVQERGRPYGDIQERGRPISSYFGQTSPQQQRQQPQPPNPSSVPQNLPVNHSRGSSYEDRVRDYPPDSRYNYQRYEQPPMPQTRDDLIWNGSRVSPYERQTNDHGRPLSLAHTPQSYHNPPVNNNMAPMSRTDPRHALSASDLPSQISRVNSGLYSQIPETSQAPPRREPRPASPIHNGPMFSLSNLESRQQLDETSNTSGSTEGHSKPVAKVPPHKIAGVKVLPSSFELPKQRPTSPKPTYKTNDDDLYWEKQKVQFRNQPPSNNNAPLNRHSSYYPSSNNNYNDYQHQSNAKGAPVINTKPGNYNPSQAPDYYRNSSGLPISQAEIYSHYNNRYAPDYGNQNGNPPLPDRRYGPADYGGPSGMDRKPPMFYNAEQSKVGGDKRKADPNGQGEDMMRKKEAEIASMFQHMEIAGGNPRVPRYASQADLNFEQSLGYYP